VTKDSFEELDREAIFRHYLKENKIVIIVYSWIRLCLMGIGLYDDSVSEFYGINGGVVIGVCVFVGLNVLNMLKFISSVKGKFVH